MKFRRPVVHRPEPEQVATPVSKAIVWDTREIVINDQLEATISNIPSNIDVNTLVITKVPKGLSLVSYVYKTTPEFLPTGKKVQVQLKNSKIEGILSSMNSEYIKLICDSQLISIDRAQVITITTSNESNSQLASKYLKLKFKGQKPENGKGVIEMRYEALGFIVDFVLSLFCENDNIRLQGQYVVKNATRIAFKNAIIRVSELSDVVYTKQAKVASGSISKIAPSSAFGFSVGSAKTKDELVSHSNVSQIVQIFISEVDNIYSAQEDDIQLSLDHGDCGSYICFDQVLNKTQYSTKIVTKFSSSKYQPGNPPNKESQYELKCFASEYLEIPNTTENKLGYKIPSCTTEMFQNGILVKSGKISQVNKGGKISILLSEVPGIYAIKSPKNLKVEPGLITEDIEVTVKNECFEEPTTVVVLDRLKRWKVAKIIKSVPTAKLEGDFAQTEVKLGIDEEVKIQYTVQYPIKKQESSTTTSQLSISSNQPDQEQSSSFSSKSKSKGSFLRFF